MSDDDLDLESAADEAAPSKLQKESRKKEAPKKEPKRPSLKVPDEEGRGETLMSEPGGSWWVVAIGPVLIAAILALEIAGKGRIHWEVLAIFGSLIVGFSVLQVIAARKHVSMELTETTLRDGAQTIAISDIVKIYPANHGPETQDWESAPALGELHAVPRRRKGIGVKLINGKLAQAWARDVEVLRRELTEAHLAIQLGLEPRGKS